MLILYDINHTKLEGLTNYKDLKLDQEINIEDTLSFLFPVSDLKHDLLVEECYIRTEDNEYVIKEVNYSDDDWTEYICKINIESIKGYAVDRFETIEQSCYSSINLALVGTDWTIGYCDVTKLRTVRKNNCSAYEVLQEIQSTYHCEMTFDSINKLVYIYQVMGSDRGSYFAEQLNLKSLSIQRNSYAYITRLIPIGKDGLDITSVNSGLNYLSNTQYSNKVFTAFWEDNRYTDPQTLKDDGVDRLAFLSLPYKSYSADVIDLANVSGQYSILDYDLGDTITILAHSKNTKEKQRIIQLTRYLDEPERNTCSIANKIVSLDDLQVRLVDTADVVETVTTSDGLLDGTKIDGVEWVQIENISIVTANIQDAAITEAKIGNLAVTTAKIASLAVTAAQIANAAIGTAKIANAAITNALIGTAAVDTLQVKDAAITTAKIGDLQVTNAKIGLLAVDSAQIALLAVGTAQIALGAITTALIGTAAVETAQIADSSITDAKIVTLTANKITAGELSTERLIIRDSVDPTKSLIYSINNITSALQAIVGDTLNGEILTERSITADRIVARAITADEIAAATITATEIAANTITAAKMVAGTITADSGIIADAAIGNAKIIDLDATKITAGFIDAARIAAGTITADKLAAGSIYTDLIMIGAQTLTESIAGLTASIAAVSGGGTNFIQNSAWGTYNAPSLYAWYNGLTWKLFEKRIDTWAEFEENISTWAIFEAYTW